MGFLTSILRDIRRAQSLQERQASLASARLALQSGQTEPMQLLADTGLGDALAALATYHATRNEPASQCEATRFYGKAGQATEWVESYAPRWQEEYETRCFLGVGADPDYELLYKSWSHGHFCGYQREIELAWIVMHSPVGQHKPEKAWEWLALDEARWGKRREARLPSGDRDTLHAALVTCLSAKLRSRIEGEAQRIAQAEFVEGK